MSVLHEPMRQWANLLGRRLIQATLAFHTFFSLQLDTSAEVRKELVAVWLRSRLVCVCVFERVCSSLREEWMTDLIVAVRAQLGPGHLLQCQPALFWPFPFSPWENNGRVCCDGWHLCGLRALLMSDKHIHNLIRVTNCVMTLTISNVS